MSHETSLQAREAVERAEAVTRELDNVSLYAFGVGRGVDRVQRQCIKPNYQFN